MARVIAAVVAVCVLSSCGWFYRHPKTVMVTPAVAGIVTVAVEPDAMPITPRGAAIMMGGLGGAVFGVLVLLTSMVMMGKGTSGGGSGDWGENWEEPLESDRMDNTIPAGEGCFAVGAWPSIALAPEADLVAGEGQTLMSTTGNGSGADELEACMYARDNGWSTLNVNLCQGGGHISGYTVYKPDCQCSVCRSTNADGYLFESYNCTVTTSALCSQDHVSRARVGYGWAGRLNQEEAQRWAIDNAVSQSSCSIFGGTITDSHIMGCQQHVINQGMDDNGNELRPIEYVCAASARCDY